VNYLRRFAPCALLFRYRPFGRQPAGEFVFRPTDPSVASTFLRDRQKLVGRFKSGEGPFFT
jgi:hypothetical protein